MMSPSSRSHPPAGAGRPQAIPANGSGMTLYASPRFEKAVAKALDDWAAADMALSAGLAHCEHEEGCVVVPFFGRRYRVSHPGGVVEEMREGPPAGDSDSGDHARPVHVSIVILILHYLLTADATPQEDRWVTFRELPGGLFYASAFESHAEAALKKLVAPDDTNRRISVFRGNGANLGGVDLDLADAAMWFQALPCLRIAALLWKGDDEFPGQARILFDASARHYLPTEDLAGMGDWLAHQLVRAG